MKSKFHVFGFVLMLVVGGVIVGCNNDHNPTSPGVTALSSDFLDGVEKGNDVNAKVICLGGNCNGQDPIVTGCVSTAVTIAFKNIPGMFLSNFSTIGVVELQYSRACGTKWAKVTYYKGNARSITAKVTRADGTSFQTVKSNCSQAWSPMVSAPNQTLPNYKARGSGSISTGFGGGNATTDWK